MRRYCHALTAIALTLAAVFTATPANAGTSSSVSDAAIVSALSRIADKTYTAADLELIKSLPEIARQVPDPTRAPTITVTRTPAVGLDDLPISCWDYWVDITSYTLLGFTHWIWRHFAGVCLDGVVVRSWTARFDQLVYSDGTAYAGALVSSAASAVPTTPAFSFMQRRIDICVFKYGCYGVYHPWSQININGDSSWWYNWGT